MDRVTAHNNSDFFEWITNGRINEKLISAGLSQEQIDDLISQHRVDHERAYDSLIDVIFDNVPTQASPGEWEYSRPAGFSDTIFVDDFNDLDTGFWRAEGSPSNPSDWGQQSPQYRTGFFRGYEGLKVVNNTELEFTLEPAIKDGVRLIAKNGRPGWWNNYLLSPHGWYTPAECFTEVMCRHEVAGGVSGVWWAPLWHGWGGNAGSRAEIDTQEYFGNRPGKVRQALHAKLNASTKMVVNVDTNTLTRHDEDPRNDTSIENIEGVHRYGQLTLKDPNNTGHWIIVKYIDGVPWHISRTSVAQAKGNPINNVFNASPQGWDLRIQSESEGAAGHYPDGFNETPRMWIDWVSVSGRSSI